MRRHASAVRIAAILIALADIHTQTATVPSSTEKTAVDALIPWLLQEDAQLRGIPFSEVIFDATGKRVLAFNPKNETDGRVLKQIRSVLDQVMAQLSAPESVVQGIPRINEVSSHFENLMRELLNKAPGLSCDFPKTAGGATQRSGYPDLELIDQQSHRVYYLDPKLYAVGSRDSSFRTFYFEPKVATNKVREGTRCISLLALNTKNRPPIGIGNLRAGTWSISHLSQVKLKAEFHGSNRDMYRPEAIVATSAKKMD